MELVKLLILPVLVVCKASVVPIDHSSSSVSVKQSGKDYSYTIQETHGVSVEPAGNLVEQSAVHVAKSAHPAADNSHHMVLSPAKDHDHVQNQFKTALEHAHDQVQNMGQVPAGLIQEQQHHEHHEPPHGHGRGLAPVQGHVVGLVYDQQRQDQSQVRAVAPFQVNQGQFRSGFSVVPVQNQVRSKVPNTNPFGQVQGVRQDQIQGHVSSVVPIFSVQSDFPEEQDINRVVSRHEQNPVEVRAFQENLRDYGVVFPVHPQGQGQLRGSLPDKVQASVAASRIGGVANQESVTKGVEAFRLIPAGDIPYVQYPSGIRYPYTVLYPFYRYV